MKDNFNPVREPTPIESPEHPGAIALRAINCIEDLHSNLPDAESLIALLKILSHVLPTLQNSLIEGKVQPFDRAALESLAGAATNIVRTLLAYSKKSPHDFAVVLEHSSEWPVLAAINPEIDIRKAGGKTKNAALASYAPILKHLGAGFLFKPKNVKKVTSFLILAEHAVWEIQKHETPNFRHFGLPWLLDFADESGLHALNYEKGWEFGDYRDFPSSRFKLTSDEIAAKQRELAPQELKQAWLLAIKYYLVLALAPEPDRTNFRAHWRNQRLEAFAKFRPDTPEEQKLHKQLLSAEPELFTSNTKCPPPIGPDLPPINPPSPARFWVRWWEQTLKYDPAAVFGVCASLNEWDDREVKTMVEAPGVAKHPMAGFGRCVDAILDAFLRHVGVKGGINSMTGKRSPNIRITTNSLSEAINRSPERQRMIAIERSIASANI